MDWDLAIKRNSEALKGIVAELFAMLGLVGEATVSRIPQPLHRAVLRVLWPAESAVRRLIIIAARGLVVKLPAAPPISRPMPSGPIGKGRASCPSFQLFDTRKNFAARRRKGRRLIPRIHIFGDDLWGNDPTVASLWAMRRPMAIADAPPPSDGLVNSERLSRRLQALKLALDDLPRQARRLARWRVRREAMPSPKFKSPIRPGPPPGHRRKPVHLVDEVLIECHGLAFDAMKPDTS
ncbi:MAG TPA: hypothetical protein VF224_13815 [Aestuariivirga sp.]